MLVYRVLLCLALVSCSDLGAIDHRCTHERNGDEFGSDTNTTMFVDLDTDMDVLLCHISFEPDRSQPCLTSIGVSMRSDGAAGTLCLSPSAPVSPPPSTASSPSRVCPLKTLRFDETAPKLIAVDVYGRVAVLRVDERASPSVHSMLSIGCYGNHNDRFVDASFWSSHEIVLARKRGHVGIWSMRTGGAASSVSLELIGKPEAFKGEPVLSDVHGSHVFAVETVQQFLRPRRSWTSTDAAAAAAAGAAVDSESNVAAPPRDAGASDVRHRSGATVNLLSV